MEFKLNELIKIDINKLFSARFYKWKYSSTNTNTNMKNADTNPQYYYVTITSIDSYIIEGDYEHYDECYRVKFDKKYAIKTTNLEQLLYGY